MKYFTQPPEIPLGKPTGNIPTFIRRRYRGKCLTLAYILQLFYWAEKEYTDVKNWAIAKQNKEIYLKVLSVNPIYLLAKSDEFKNIVELMDETVWREIPSVIKQSLQEAYKIYSQNAMLVK